MLLLPLITGGALAGMLKNFGIRLPAGLSNIGGGRSDMRGGVGVQDLLKMAQMFV